MKEDDYVRACNFARVSAALELMRNILPQDAVQRGLYGKAAKALSNLCDEIKESIKIDEFGG